MRRLQVCAPQAIVSYQKDTRKRSPFFLAFLLLMSLLAACGDGSTTAQPASSPTKAVSASMPTPTKKVITSPLVGTYTTTITQKDISASAQPDATFNLGTHTWTFSSDGTFHWLYRGPNTQNTSSFVANGSYQLSASELSVTDQGCEYDGFPGPGTYTWQIKGNDLIMQAKSDECVYRKLALTTHPLVRQAS